MSQALYRTYRPQRFDDVVGQDVAVRTLRNAIETDRVAHAYLFTGTKGTGKTTLAKLLAKAMNCVNGPTVDPCGECEECVAIAEGRSLDVAEIDAASSTGIDAVREKIIDTVAFQPSRGTRRVYIIDEAHQLSKSAFNALLKTIEEPPPHVIFVFCTTETHMMMATVRDRCQRITMRSPGPDTLRDVLAVVCERENITADDAALRAIARASQGSFRNALGTLEMLTTTFGPTITRDDVLGHLGVVSEDVLFAAADAVIDGDGATVLRLVEQLSQDGVDLDQFARAQAEHLRELLLQRNGLDEFALVGDAQRLAQQAERADERVILGAIDCLADAATRMRVGSDPRLTLETALVRAAQRLGLPMLALRLATLEKRATGDFGQPVQPMAGAAAAAPERPAASAAPAPAQPAAPEVDASATPPATSMPTGELANVAAWWPQLVTRVSSNAALRVTVAKLEPRSATAKQLVVGQLQRVPVTPKLTAALADAARDVTGHQLAVVVEDPAPVAAHTPADSPAPTPTPSPVAASAAPPEHDEGLDNLISMFDATPVQPGD